MRLISPVTFWALLLSFAVIARLELYKLWKVEEKSYFQRFLSLQIVIT